MVDKDWQAAEARLKRWPRLAHSVRRWETGIYATLLKDYLLVRSLIEEVPNPAEASFIWHQYQKDALLEFAHSYEPLRAKTTSELMEGALNREAIQAIRNDLDAISEALDSPPSEETLARLMIAGIMGGTTNSSDVLRELDNLKETTPDGIPIDSVVKEVVAHLKGSSDQETKSVPGQENRRLL
jgi:hypothetical protein